jgi:hypothetical protein
VNASSRGSIAKTTIRYQIAADNTRNLSILLSNECRDAKFPKARCFPVAPVANFFLFWNSGVRMLSFSTKAIECGRKFTRSTCSWCSSQAITGLPMNFISKKRSRQNLDRPEGCSNRCQFLLGNTLAIDGRILWWH